MSVEHQLTESKPLPAEIVFERDPPRRTIRELTPDEHKRRREGSDVYPYQLVPTGELSVNLADSWSSRAVTDRKKARLEDSLNEFIEMLVERAYGDKAARARREEEERRRREAEAREREDERRTRAEEAKRDHFDGLAQHWKRNQERREFLADLPGPSAMWTRSRSWGSGLRGPSTTSR